jgi:hypothetical protein
MTNLEKLRADRDACDAAWEAALDAVSASRAARDACEAADTARLAAHRAATLHATYAYLAAVAAQERETPND